jgi:hypothetical protein
VTIIDGIQSSKVFRPLFKDLSTWRPWVVFLKVLFGLSIEAPEDRELVKTCTGLIEPPKERVRECAAICGRRSGKSFISAVIAVFMACFKDWTPYLSPGERAMIFIVAVDKSQAGIIKRYVSGILDSSPILRKMIARELQEQIDLKNRVSIAVKTCSYRSVRGYTIVCAILEETAFWRSELTANPDREVVGALRPALATIPESLLLFISTPYSRRGILWDTFCKAFGNPGKTLVWKAPSLMMNPTLDREIIEDALKDDPQAAAAEWQVEWRQDIESFLSFEALQACVVRDRFELPPIDGMKYTAFIDPSGGGQDSFGLAISHTEANGRFIILDKVVEWRPPFNPNQVVIEAATIMKVYRCFWALSDRYARDWIRDSLRACGVDVNFSKLSASELYLEFLPIVMGRRCELLDNQRLIGQLGNLERRVRQGGYDLVTHFPGQHDDLANAAAGAVVYATGKGRSVVMAYGADEREKDRLPEFTFSGPQYKSRS